jgi:plasmid replication initiation protein
MHKPRDNNPVFISMTDKSLVVQHNKIIEAKYKLSVGEQRLIKLLVSMIEPEDEDFKAYRIAVIDLIRLLGLSDKDFYGKVKSWSKKLISNVLIFRGEDEEELQVAWLSSAIYKPKSGFVELEFSPKLKPFLLHLKSHFTAYELGNVIRLKHTYSIRIYELLKQYEKIGRRKFSIENLRELLMLEDDEYRQFCDFRRWVLRTAQNELEEKTDIAFTWEEERKKQKCIAIEFFIKSQKRPNGIALSNTKAQSVEVVDEEQDNQIILMLIDLGITRKAAEELASEYSEEHIQAKITYAEAQWKEGKVKSLPGFAVDAIRNGYRDNQAEERQRKEEAARLEADKEAKRKEWERMKARWNAWKAEQVKAHIAAMDAETLEREKAGFRESFKGSVMAKTVFANRENEARHFRIYVTGKMEGLRVSEWARAVKVDLSPFIEFVRSE